MSVFNNIPQDSVLVNRRDPEELLGSFSPHTFELDGLTWATAEHYYQYNKFVDPQHQQKIFNAETPIEAKKLGNKWLKKKRNDLKKVRVVLMTRAMYIKCKTHFEISQALLDTQDKYIAESSFTDYFWGCGRDGRGENHFGKMLMGIREKLVSEQ